MIRAVVIGAAGALLLGGAWLLAREAREIGPGVAGGVQAGAGHREPEILLRGVEVREIRKDRKVHRFQAEDAVYRVQSKRLLAERVVLTLRGEREGIRVLAPRAEWEMEAGTVDLPEGGSAEGGSGWTASVPDARIDLKGQVMSAGRASLSVPGVRVEGARLVWRWEEGTVELASPESRLIPSALSRKIPGRGGTEEAR